MNRKTAVPLVLCALSLACTREREAPTPAAKPWAEDEFAARAAAVAKSCELATVYLGRDDARAAVVVNAARVEALAALRRAPDSYRGGAFARAYRRLDDAAVTLAGAGSYAPPLSVSEYDRLREGLTAAADELRPIGEPYYRKLNRRYDGPPAPKWIMGPMAGPLSGGVSRAPAGAPTPASAETAGPAPEPPGAGTATPAPSR